MNGEKHTFLPVLGRPLVLSALHLLPSRRWSGFSYWLSLHVSRVFHPVSSLVQLELSGRTGLSQDLLERCEINFLETTFYSFQTWLKFSSLCKLLFPTLQDQVRNSYFAAEAFHFMTFTWRGVLLLLLQDGGIRALVLDKEDRAQPLWSLLSGFHLRPPWGGQPRIPGCPTWLAGTPGAWSCWGLSRPSWNLRKTGLAITNQDGWPSPWLLSIVRTQSCSVYRVYNQGFKTGRLPSGCYPLPVLVPGAVGDSPGHLTTRLKQV